MWLHKFSVCLWFPTLICCLVLTSVLCPIFGSCRYVWYVTILSFISVLSFTTAECTPTMHRWPWFMLHFLSCLYACHKDFQSLKQLLCVNQPLFFFFKQAIFCLLYCPVLIWAFCLTCWQGWYFFPSPCSHWCVIYWVLHGYWVLKFQHRIFPYQSVLQTSLGLHIW